MLAFMQGLSLRLIISATLIACRVAQRFLRSIAQEVRLSTERCMDAACVRPQKREIRGNLATLCVARQASRS
jgi:hypothetical protein